MIKTGQLPKSIRATYNRTVNSIAFYPALIAVGFLFLSWLMLSLDFSEAGKHIKANYSWIRLKDASTARTIVSTIAAGVISLMVFSFSMVMILLNQAASQMSNRMLESMIGNRFQQLVLGFYIGTIVYSLFLLSTIRDIESGIYVPALSIYLLLIITIGDIFAFIYFLHYVTQSVKFETIIDRVHRHTLHALRKTCTAKEPQSIPHISSDYQLVYTEFAGYYQGFDKKALLRYADKHAGVVRILHPPGKYLLKGQPVLQFEGINVLTEDDIKNLLGTLDFYTGQVIEHNFLYGFHQLTEVALKALSPGINDPETAVLSLNALADLFYYRLNNHPELIIKDNRDEVRIYLADTCLKDLLAESIYPIWDYGNKDRYIQNALKDIIMQLINSCQKGEFHQSLTAVLNKVNESIAKHSIAIISR